MKPAVLIHTGVIHGRFQVLHNDHLIYLLAGKRRCRHLVVGVTNPDPSLTAEDPADPKRSLPSSNPLTFFERHTMIREALCEAGVALSEFTVVPFPINFPHLYGYYVPLDATFFLTIYDDWGRRKRARFEESGLRIEVLWERSAEDKGIEAGTVRRSMIEGAPWEHRVPPSTARLMKAWDIPGRLRRMTGDSTLRPSPVP